MSLALLLALPALATDVLFPEVTPRAISDLGLSGQMTASMAGSLMNTGLDVADPEIVAARAGAGSGGCADNLDCPHDLWDHFPDARLAVVASVGALPEGTALLVRFYAWNQRQPVDELELSVAPGAEAAVSQRVAERAVRLFAEVPARPVSPSAPEGPPPPRIVIIAPPVEPEPAPAPEPAREGRLHGEMGLTPWDQSRFEASGLDEDAFRKRYRVRSGQFGVDLWGGAAFGDVDRYYDVRLSVSDDGGQLTERGAYQYSTFRNSVAATFGATLSYAPIAWAEATLGLGLQLTRQEQVVGYELSDTPGATRVAFTPGRTMLLEVAPGFRLLPISAGAAKPYLMAAFDLRFYPPYSSVDYQGLTYPDLPGGVALGPTLGLGVALDAGKHATGFLEIPWTLVLWPEPSLTGASALQTLPDEPLGVGQYLVFKAGLGFRY